MRNAKSIIIGISGLSFQNIVGDIQSLILDPKNANCVFQAASQFNCLEMIEPSVTPDDGITIYCDDHTQGPICAMVNIS